MNYDSLLLRKTIHKVKIPNLIEKHENATSSIEIGFVISIVLVNTHVL